MFVRRADVFVKGGGRGEGEVGSERGWVVEGLEEEEGNWGEGVID